MDYPPVEFSRLVKRLERRELPSRHRHWTGNDESRRYHHGRIPAGENPVFLELAWKRNGTAQEKLVGCFSIDVEALKRQGYLGPDPSGGVRLRFLHGEDGLVYVGRGIKSKRIPIGRV